MNNSLLIKAYGKINLALSITGQREDGYHTLKTVMQSISLYNELKIESSNSLTLVCDDPALPTDERNTAFLAAKLFYQKAKLPERDKLTLFKKIPYQAGLGSASSDAAAVLCGLNQLYNFPLSQDQLLLIGETVGADVPFAITGGTVLCEGIGEILTPLPPIPECFIVIVVPSFKMSTPIAYKMIDNMKNYTDIDISAIEKGLISKNINVIATHCDNIFAKVCYPKETREIINDFLSLGALGASLSGSGSAVFGIFSEKEQAVTASKQFFDAYLCYPSKKSIEIKILTE